MLDTKTTITDWITPAQAEPALEELLDRSAAIHGHLCPRQVLGVRMGLYAMELLGLGPNRRQKQLYAVSETDGCFVSGVQTAAGASVNRRTLRVMDYGKIAAAFIDRSTGAALRIHPRADVRRRAWDYSAGETRRYQAMLMGYRRMPFAELFDFRPIELTISLQAWIGRPGVRVNCAGCGEEIINQRERIAGGRPYCRPCSGDSYFSLE